MGLVQCVVRMFRRRPLGQYQIMLLVNERHTNVNISFIEAAIVVHNLTAVFNKLYSQVVTFLQETDLCWG